MTQDPTKMPPVDDTATPLSADRRRLLKAAAISTPIIATLPSGAVFANASHVQCLFDAEANAGNVANEIDPASDLYVRYEGVIGTWYKLDGEGDLACQDGEGNWVKCKDIGGAAIVEFKAYGKPRPTPNEWILIERNGAPVEPPVSWTPPYPPHLTEAKNLLTIFTMDAEKTGADLVGWYPQTRQVPGFGMVQSCLCSVDPQLRGNSPFC